MISAEQMKNAIVLVKSSRSVLFHAYACRNQIQENEICYDESAHAFCAHTSPMVKSDGQEYIDKIHIEKRLESIALKA